MARTETFQLSVVTPERVVEECEARFVALPAYDGEIGVLRHRAPLLCKLAPGVLRVERGDGSKVELFVDGGFAEMAANRLTVLTEAARSLEELDEEQVRSEMKEARGLPSQSETEFEARQEALARARAKQKMLGS
jgi:F-type H+-transporting ATPase subunit epsilon